MVCKLYLPSNAHSQLPRASELLLSIPADRRKAKAKWPQSASPQETAEAELEEEEQDVLAGARSLGEAKEYMRASKMLHECKSARGRFMRWYFDFLVRPAYNSKLKLNLNQGTSRKRREL